MRKLNVYNVAKLLALCVVMFFTACGGDKPSARRGESTRPAPAPKPLTVYLADQYIGLRPALEVFGTTNNVQLDIVSPSEDDLVAQFATGVAGGTADVLVSDDVADLLKAQDEGLLQPFSTPELDKNVDESFWGEGSYWFAFMRDVEVLAALRNQVQHTELNNYEDLLKTKWKGKLLLPNRSRMQNFLAQMLIVEGTPKTKKWLKTAHEHLALPANLSDEDLVRAIGDRKATVALLSGATQIRLHRGGDPVEDERGDRTGIKLPANAQGSSYFSLAGFALSKSAPHRATALQLADFLVQQANQDKLSYSMEMYPVHPFAVPSDYLIDLGGFVPPDFSWQLYRQKHTEAGQLLDQYNWGTTE